MYNFTLDFSTDESSDSSSSSLFAGEPQSCESTDITPPDSPTEEHICRIGLEIEQAPIGHGNSASVTPTQCDILRASPLLKVQFSNEDSGYEAECEGPRMERYGPKRLMGRNFSAPRARVQLQRGTTAALPIGGDFPKAKTLTTDSSPCVLRRRTNPTSTVALANIPSPFIRAKFAKAATGVGLGLPSYLLQTPRALTAPVLTWNARDKLASTPCPLPKFSPRNSEMRPVLRPTVIPGSPSPMESLPPPSQLSYYENPGYLSVITEKIIPLQTTLREITSPIRPGATIADQ